MILNRYFLKTIFSYTLAISLIFILIIVSSRSIQYLEQASRGEINPEIVFSVILLRLPEFLELILPLGFYLSILLTIGKLRADSELIVMEQSGFSASKIYTLLSVPAILIISILLTFTFTLGPTADERVRSLLDTKSLEDKFNALLPGKFHKLNNSYLFYAKEKDSNGLKNVFLYQKDEEKSQVNILMANSLSILDLTDEGLQFIQGTSFSVTEPDKLMKLNFENYLLQKRFFLDETNENELTDFNTAEALLWSASIFLLIVITSLIALPISKTSPRTGRYSRVLPGLMIFAVYAGTLLTFKDAIKENLIYIFIIHLIFLLVSIILNFRMYKEIR